MPKLSRARGALTSRATHRSAQRQYNASSRPLSRPRRPQRPPRVRPSLWDRPLLQGPRACGGLLPPCGRASCTALSTRRAPARAPHTPHRNEEAAPRATAARPARTVRCARPPCARRHEHRAAQQHASGSPPSARRPRGWHHHTAAAPLLRRAHARTAGRAAAGGRRCSCPLAACHRCARVQSMWERTLQGQARGGERGRRPRRRRQT
jgi:hypothetical protein